MGQLYERDQWIDGLRTQLVYPHSGNVRRNRGRFGHGKKTTTKKTPYKMLHRKGCDGINGKASIYNSHVQGKEHTPARENHI